MTAVKIDTRAVMGILVIFFVLALGYSTISSYLIGYKTVTQVAGGNSSGMIWVNGTILKGTFESVEPGEYAFELTDGTSTINVSFNGDLPSSLGQDAEVVIYGTFRDRTFRASRLISKCPTKYEG